MVNGNDENQKSAVKHSDFGAKIGGAKKDLWRERGLLSGDLADMNEREADKYVTKDNVWKKPDYQALIDGGIPVDVAYFIKTVRDSLAASPAYRYTDDTPNLRMARQAEYIDTIREIMAVIEGVRTKEDVLAAFTRCMIEGGYYGQVQSGMTGYYASPTEKGRANTVITDKLANAIYVKNERDFRQKITQKAEKAQFGVSKEDKVPAGYDIRYTNGKSEWYKNNGWTPDTFFVVKGNRILEINFESRDAALRWVQEYAKGRGGDGKTRFVPRQLEKIERTGPDYRQGRDIVGEDYLETFGFKGGEHGNWMSQLDRQASLNYGYDAFRDLAAALKISDNDISYGGVLSIAFGARGSGNAVAHYEPLRKVINLTKMNGAGSLAHEWWHGFDDFMGAKMGAGTLLSERPHNHPLFKKLIETMKYKDATPEQAAAMAEQADTKARRNAERWTQSPYMSAPKDADETVRAEYAKLHEAFLRGEDGSVDKISELRKKVTGRVIPKGDRDTLVHVAYHMRSIAERKEPVIRRVDTDYYRASKEMGEITQKDGNYWDSNTEMTARAFATYIQDKLPWRSDYLAGHAECAVNFKESKDGKLEIVRAFPEGEERKAINAVFDEIIAELKLQQHLTHDEQQYDDFTPAMPGSIGKEDEKMMEHQLYDKFAAMFPEFMNGEYSTLLLEAEHAPTLRLEWIFGDQFFISHSTDLDGIRNHDPMVMLSFNSKEKTVTAISLDLSDPPRRDVVYKEAGKPDVAMQENINAFTLQWLDRAAQQRFRPFEATYEVDENGEVSKTGKITDKTVTIAFDADGRPVIPEPEQREVQVGDILLIEDKKWRVEKIDGDFSLSMKNLNPNDIQTDQMYMGRWKEKLNEAGYTILTAPDTMPPAPAQEADAGSRQYPAPTPPPNANPKNTMPHKNYTQLEKLFPNIVKHPDVYHDITYRAGQNGEALRVCWEDTETLTLTRIAGDQADPVLYMKINQDEKTLTPTVLDQTGVFLGVDGANEAVMSDIYGRLDAYLAEWLRDAGKQGYKKETAQIYGDDPQRLGKLYFNEKDKAFWIGMGHMGNGLAVWNRLEEKHGDYVTVAHINHDRTVSFYDKGLPPAAIAMIENTARTSDSRVSATQDAPVFSVPPIVEQEPEKAQPEQDELRQFAADYFSYMKKAKSGVPPLSKQYVARTAKKIAESAQQEGFDGIRTALSLSMQNDKFAERYAEEATALMERLNILAPPAITAEPEQLPPVPVPEDDAPEPAHTATEPEHTEPPDAPEPDRFAPDTSIGISERDLFGYTNTDILPLTADRALELFDQNMTIYMLYPDNTEITVFEREEIERHDGIFGVEQIDWEATREFAAMNAAAVKNGASNESALIDGKEDTFHIYQVRSGALYRDHKWESLSSLAERGLSVDRINYELVYTAPLTAADTLDSLYERFNINRPADFTGHSMTTSDVVVLQRGGEVTSHFVDDVGFANLSNFLGHEKQPEIAASEVERFENDHIADITVSSPPGPSVAELEAQADAGKVISLHDLANAVKRESKPLKPKSKNSLLADLEKNKKIVAQGGRQAAPQRDTTKEVRV